MSPRSKKWFYFPYYVMSRILWGMMSPNQRNVPNFLEFIHRPDKLTDIFAVITWVMLVMTLVVTVSSLLR